MAEKTIPQESEAPKEGWEGLKDELLASLPPWAKEFLERHAREIISAILIIVLGVALWSGYSTYSKRQQASAAALLGQAMRLQNSQDKINALEKLIKENGNSYAGRQAQLLLAAELRESGNLDKAKAAFKSATAKLDGPLSTSATMGLGYISERQTNLNEAADAYRKAAEKKDGFEAVAYLDLGRVESARDNGQAAVDAYNQYLTLAPDSQLLDYVRYKIENLSKNIEAKEAEPQKQ